MSKKTQKKQENKKRNDSAENNISQLWSTFSLYSGTSSIYRLFSRFIVIVRMSFGRIHVNIHYSVVMMFFFK